MVEYCIDIAGVVGRNQLLTIFQFKKFFKILKKISIISIMIRRIIL